MSAEWTNKLNSVRAPSITAPSKITLRDLFIIYIIGFKDKKGVFGNRTPAGKYLGRSCRRRPYTMRDIFIRTAIHST